MATVKRFEDLDIWKLAREICNDIHRLTEKDPFCKDYGLKDQVRRSTGSAMDNIAEGFERDGNNEFIQFLSIAKASSGEARSQMCRAFDRSYLTQEKFNEVSLKMIELSAKIQNTISYLKKSVFKGHKFKVE